MSELFGELLWLGVEDYTGLWEAAREVARDQPDLADSEVRSRTAELLIGLAGQQFVELFRCVEPCGLGAVTEIGASDLEALLAADSAWVPPSRKGQVTIRYATTDRGEAAYRELSTPD